MTATPRQTYGEDSNVVVRDMLTPSNAVDLYLGDVASRSRSQDGRTVASYRRTLDKFTDHLGPYKDVSEITPDDCRRFLDRYSRGLNGRRPHNPGTRANTYAVVNGFLSWLRLQEKVKRNPLEHVPRPRRVSSDDLDVTTVSEQDVLKMIACAKGWTERLAVAIPAYTGARRRAVANLRVGDYDPARGVLRFREKGGKVVWKPIPRELQTLLNAYVASLDQPEDRAGDYLVPPDDNGVLVRDGDRDDRVIWRAVKSAANRAGVDAHVHALRAAFAVKYLESHKGDLEALKELMGHESIATTQTYLRRLDKQAAMERVRDLSWGVAEPENVEAALLAQIAGLRNQSSSGVGAGGFEPPFPDPLGAERLGSQRQETEVEK